MEPRGFLISRQRHVCGLGIIKGAQSQISCSSRLLLLVIFLQMKIENTAADNILQRQTPGADICQPVCSVVKRSYSVREMVCNQTQSHMQRRISSRETIRSVFSSISTAKIIATQRMPACRHDNRAAGKNITGKTIRKDHDNGDQVAALIFSIVIGIKKSPPETAIQRKIDCTFSQEPVPETEKGHDQADHSSTSQGEILNSRTRKSSGGTETKRKISGASIY